MGNIYLTITIDVEPDCSPTWHYSSPLTFKGVTVGIKERLQPLFNKHHIIPTYLINNVVLEDKESVEVFRNLTGRFELGTHLHPEFIEPMKKYDNYAGKKGEADLCFYPKYIEFEKIKNITQLFFEKFGYYPASFRAGRFSAGPNTIESLQKLGYKVDTSVTPHICWDDFSREKPVDYTNALEQPYLIKPGSLLQSSNEGKILEVPVSIRLEEVNFFTEFLKSFAGLRRPINRRVPQWLRPYYSNFKDFKKICNYLKKSYDENMVVYNMMFHNVEVLPGLSPYTKTNKESERYLNLLNSFFDFCSDNNILSRKISDLYNEYI